jgi:hypothetical protein
MYIGLHVKYSLFVSDFDETYIFWADFLKVLKYQISWKSLQYEPSFSCLLEGGTDDEANIRFFFFFFEGT